MKKHIICCLIGVFACLFNLSSARADNTIITATGIGKVKLGSNISKLPKAIDGLYDRIEFASEVDYDDGEEYTFEVYHAYLGESIVFEIYPQEGKVSSITVLSSNLKTQNGLSLTSTPSDLFTAGGKVVSLNDGTIAIDCDGARFFGMTMSKQGNMKAEQAYLGYEVAFEVSDFDASAHPGSMVIYGGSSVQTGMSSSANMSLKDILLGGLFIAAILAMIGHMVFVNYFAKTFPEETISLKGTDLNNSFVASRMDNLYNNVFTSYQDSGGEPLKFPVGSKAASEARRTLKDIYDNHMPVDGEAAEKLRKVSILTNEAYRRSFSGSIKFLIITAVIGAGACFLNKDATPLLYFIPSCVLYFFSCMTPYYNQMEKALKEKKTGKRSKGFMDAILGGVFGIAASAPMIVEVTKDANSGEVLDKQNDHSLKIIALVVSFMLFIMLAYAMLFIGIFNYVKNYILR